MTFTDHAPVPAQQLAQHINDLSQGIRNSTKSDKNMD
jgi:hypothetical protein